MTGRRFTHSEAGTPESVWLASPRWDDCQVIEIDTLLEGHDRLVVASAHPDDETLGVGGLITDAAAAGMPVHVVVATPGEASHPDSTTWTPQRLAAARMREVEEAVGVLAPGARVTHLGHPDGGLAHVADALRDQLAATLTGDTLLLAPWCDDGHPDHDTLGLAAGEAAAEAGCVVHYYPVWLWHWATPETAPWPQMFVVEPTSEAQHRKRKALLRFPTQTQPLSPRPGDEPVVTPEVLARAERLVEVLLDTGPGGEAHTGSETDDERAATFDAMYADSDDPWEFEESFYEHRKRALTLGILGRSHYDRVLEVGCATGKLTHGLARRSGTLIGLDTSGRALAVAALHTPSGTRWLQGTAPGDLPEGPFDLIVLSEVGYFLTPSELLATLRGVRARLAEGGEIVLAHWQHPTEDIPLDGVLVHEQAHHVIDLPLRATYLDADVRIDAWGEPVSVAATEGRR
ncbi:MAG: PIG-L family deacetylase [Dermatophilus congolensis]|nr:PIG-L family deacetylase [Dermatophilus congolensis]